jgi:hypothetical protein
MPNFKKLIEKLRFFHMKNEKKMKKMKKTQWFLAGKSEMTRRVAAAAVVAAECAVVGCVAFFGFFRLFDFLGTFFWLFLTCWGLFFMFLFIHCCDFIIRMRMRLINSPRYC